MPLDVLLVEDEPTLLLTLGDALEEAGHRVTRRSRGDQAAEILSGAAFDVLVTDVRLPGLTGDALARRALTCQPPLRVILMTAFGHIEQAVELIKSGATEYLTKPFHEKRLVALLTEVEKDLLPRRAGLATGPVAASPAMAQVQKLALRVAQTDVSVLLQGETGCGKEVLARFIHENSPRARAPFIGVNCAAIAPDLVESELFGHGRGAFTGAVHRREGWIRASGGGTLFLDEVAELSMSTQARLLRALESREIIPVGTDHPVPVDFRLVAATHRDLHQEVARGTFREDLLYRLCAFELTIPPLRDRPEDVVALAYRFLDQMRDRFPSAPTTFTPEALALLVSHPWPGNARELRNAVEHAVVLAGGAPIQASHLPARVVSGLDPNRALDLRQASARAELDLLRRALAVTQGRKAEAAALLGISRKHLWELMQRHGMGGKGE